MTRSVVLLSALSFGCHKEPEQTPGPGEETAAPTEVLPDPTAIDAVPTEVIGVPNIDDDDGDGDADCCSSRSLVDGENDLSAFIVPASFLSALGPDDRVTLTLSGDDVRVWYEGSLAMDAEDRTTTLSANASDVTLDVEFGDFLAGGSITLSWTDATGGTVATSEVMVQAAPLILNHHLQPAEETWLMDIAAFGGNNQMVAAYTDALGEAFHPIDDNTYDYDVWVQDEIEFATVTAPGHRVDVVIDSIRDRGLDPFAEGELEGPDRAVMVWGDGFATSQDSFGNLEVTPPFTAPDGTSYPFGRIYYGDAGGSWLPTRELTTFLEDQKVQAPLVLDTSWLCVGHVDEFLSFVPDPTAPKGFRLLVADVGVAWDLLDPLDPDTELPRYASGHNLDTIGAIAENSELRALNDDLQSDYIDPVRDQLVVELGLTEDEVIRFPALFEEASFCGRYVAALIPGTPNLIVQNRTEDERVMFWADPFFRSDENDLESDLLIPTMEALVPATSYVWLDDWDVYHLGLGEVHCGTNVTRTPVANWWEEAMHLLR